MEGRTQLKLILQDYDDVQTGLRIVSSGGSGEHGDEP
jgi:hypothetical protein